METWDAMRSRRDVRTFAERPIPDEDLNRILEAARRSPSSANQQRWDFVICTDRERLRQLGDAGMSGGAGHVANAPAAIALVAPVTRSDYDRDSVHYDLGQATMSIMLAAADRGIGSGHAAVGDQDLARRVLGLPDDRFCRWLVVLGYPTDRPLTPIRHPRRRSFESVVHRDRW